MENSDSEMQKEIPGVRRSSRKKTPSIKFSEYELPECKSSDATKISKIPVRTQKRKTKEEFLKINVLFLLQKKLRTCKNVSGR